jgi:hypothetical protein
LICHEKPYNSLQDDFYILSCFESEEGRRSQESGVRSQERRKKEERRKKKEGRRKEEGRRKLPNYQLPITNYQLPITNYQLPITNYQLLITMLGTFQQSQIRIEIAASANAIHDSILHPAQLKKWLLGQSFPPEMPTELPSGFEFTTHTGPISIHHRVDVVKPNCLRLLLSGGIDGFHEWYWGEGWIQSRLEGISILPLNLGQTLSLVSLRQFLTTIK